MLGPHTGKADALPLSDGPASALANFSFGMPGMEPEPLTSRVCPLPLNCGLTPKTFFFFFKLVLGSLFARLRAHFWWVYKECWELRLAVCKASILRCCTSSWPLHFSPIFISWSAGMGCAFEHGPWRLPRILVKKPTDCAGRWAYPLLGDLWRKVSSKGH